MSSIGVKPRSEQEGEVRSETKPEDVERELTEYNRNMQWLDRSSCEGIDNWCNRMIKTDRSMTKGCESVQSSFLWSREG